MGANPSASGLSGVIQWSSWASRQPTWACGGCLGAIFGPWRGHLGAILDLFGDILGHLEVILGLPAAILGILGAILGPSWGFSHLEVILDLLAAILGILGAVLGPPPCVCLSASLPQPSPLFVPPLSRPISLSPPFPRDAPYDGACRNLSPSSGCIHLHACVSLHST